MTGPRAPATRTYVVLRYHGPPLGGSPPPPGYAEAEPLGTVEAANAADAKSRAAARWPDAPPAALRVRAARQASARWLATALARDAAARTPAG